MGRPELPVDPAAGPVQRLANDLRELRRAAGNVPVLSFSPDGGSAIAYGISVTGGDTASQRLTV